MPPPPPNTPGLKKVPTGIGLIRTNQGKKIYGPIKINKQMYDSKNFNNAGNWATRICNFISKQSCIHLKRDKTKFLFQD